MAPDDPAGTARELAEDLLFPAAEATDAASSVPVSHLDALAAAGLYGVAGPPDRGGVGAPVRAAITEALAGGCLSTALVWIQHHTAVRAVATAPARAGAWLGPLCRGERRAGVAFAYLRRPGPAAVSARRVDGSWRLDGEAPWVSGWGRIDVVFIGARNDDGDIVWSLVDAMESETVQVAPLSLVAVAASGTVTLRLRDHVVRDDRVVAIEAFEAWLERDAGRLAGNGFLALGVARRCTRLLGDDGFDAAIAASRAALLDDDIDAIPAARAHASALALRAATALVVHGGGRSMLRGGHAERLMREAVFLQVFGQTPAIKSVQMAALQRD